MIKRAFGGFLVVFIILLFLRLGGVWFELFWLLVTLQAFREGEGFFRKKGVESARLTPFRCSAMFLLSVYLFFSIFPFLSLSGPSLEYLTKVRIPGALFSPLCGLWLFLLLRVLMNRGRQIEEDFIKTSSAFLVFAYVSVFYFSVYQLSVMKGAQAPGIILFLFLVMWLQDTLAYFGGMLCGRHKMSPILSPKKTWEGAVCGFLGAFFVLLPFSDLFADFVTRNFILLFVLVAFSGQLGDLAESFLKRGFNIKDSGNIVPGHGGVLDRFDSVTAAAFVVVSLLIFSDGFF